MVECNTHGSKINLAGPSAKVSCIPAGKKHRWERKHVTPNRRQHGWSLRAAPALGTTRVPSGTRWLLFSPAHSRWENPRACTPGRRKTLFPTRPAPRMCGGRNLPEQTGEARVVRRPGRKPWPKETPQAVTAATHRLAGATRQAPQRCRHGRAGGAGSAQCESLQVQLSNQGRRESPVA